MGNVEGKQPGYSTHPRGEVDGKLRFALVGPDGECLPLRLLTRNEAEALASVLNVYLDDSEEA